MSQSNDNYKAQLLQKGYPVTAEENIYGAMKRSQRKKRCPEKLSELYVLDSKETDELEEPPLKQSSQKNEKQKIFDDQLGQEDLKESKQPTRMLKESKAVNQNQKRKRIKATEEETKKKRTESIQRKRDAEKEIIRKAIELEFLATSHNQELTADEKEVLKLAEKIRAKKLRAFQQSKIIAEKRSPEESKAYKLKCLEIQKNSRRKKREKQNEILRKANELLAVSQNRELSSDEKELLRLGEQVKAERLRAKELKKKNRKKLEANLTPEQKEANKLKRNESDRRIRAAKPRNSFPDDHCPEYYSDLALKKRETEQRARTKRREKAIITLQKANELLTTSQNRELSYDEKEILKLAEEIKARRLRIQERRRRYRLMRKAECTPEEKEALKLKKIKQKEAQDRSREKLSSKEALKEKRSNYTQKPLMRKNGATSKKHLQKRRGLEIQASGCLRKDQILDDIKIEPEDLTETTINAIPVRLNANSILGMQQEVFDNYSPCSWIQLSKNSFLTKRISKNHRYFLSPNGGSSCIQKSFAHCNGHSTHLHRRKSSLKKSLRCMKVVIDATSKRDLHTVFGKQIAQKLRTSKKDAAEINIAKMLIDEILQNLTTGLYSL